MSTQSTPHPKGIYSNIKRLFPVIDLFSQLTGLEWAVKKPWLIERSQLSCLLKPLLLSVSGCHMMSCSHENLVS